MDRQRALSCGCNSQFTLPGSSRGHSMMQAITAQCLTFFGTKCAIRLGKKKKSQKSLSFPSDYCKLLLQNRLTWAIITALNIQVTLHVSAVSFTVMRMRSCSPNTLHSAAKTGFWNKHLHLLLQRMLVRPYLR